MTPYPGYGFAYFRWRIIRYSIYDCDETGVETGLPLDLPLRKYRIEEFARMQPKTVIDWEFDL